MSAAHKRRDWIKVRSSWWTSPNHQLISFGAKAFGLFLLHLADSDPEWRSTGRGRVLGPSGVALRLEDGCRMVGVRSRDGRRWVAELRSVGTLCEDESGCLYFPNYREHQEDSSARRKRRSRKGRDIHRDSHASCHASVTGEVEVEVEAEVDTTTTQTTSVSSVPQLALPGQAAESDEEGSDSPRPTMHYWADEVWNWFESECVERGFAKKAKKLTSNERSKIKNLMSHIRGCIAVGQSLDDTARVAHTMRKHLEYRLERASVDRNERKYIRGVGMWRRKTFDFWWGYVVEGTEPIATESESSPETPEQADAYCRAHGKYPAGWTFRKSEGWVRK